jgi:hypothetical protein
MSAEDCSSSLIVVRDGRGWRDRARSYELVIDGATVAKIRRGQRIELPISPGRHKVFMRINWGTSDPVELEARPRESVQLFCTTGGSQQGSGYIDLMHGIPESRGGRI